MIKARKGKVMAKGTPCDIISEYMCITLGIVVNHIIPIFGKENARTELYKLIDEVLDAVEESEEENCHKN